jgi:hypothetical protein
VIDEAVSGVLAADPELVAMLGTFNGGPAIFVHDRVPDSFEHGGMAYVVMRDGDFGGPLDGDGDFFTPQVEIHVIGASDGDAADVEAAAMRIQDLLRGADIAPSGYVPGGVGVRGPTAVDTDDLSFVRRLVATVGLTESGP